MKLKYVFFIILISVSCRSLPEFERAYYERITGIKFPDNYTILATEDNGELFTLTVFQLDRAACVKLIHEHRFKEMDKENPPFTPGLSLLDSTFQERTHSNTFFVKAMDKVPGKTGWTYLIDTSACKLYCEIDYPDWGGN